MSAETVGCAQCGRTVAIADYGCEERHTVPCGRQCVMTAYEREDACDGRCPACRKAVTGCGGINEPCGRTGCSECGAHIAAEYIHETVCRGAPPSRLMAWTWDRVTCAGCLEHRPAPGGEGGHAL